MTKKINISVTTKKLWKDATARMEKIKALSDGALSAKEAKCGRKK